MFIVNGFVKKTIDKNFCECILYNNRFSMEYAGKKEEKYIEF